MNTASFQGVMSAESYARCHRSTNVPARAFNRSRDWYGRVRGSDGIFSFHPFDPARISYNGYSRGVALWQSLIDVGVIDRYDPARHPSARYTSLPGMAE
jgi:hypothetical protein